MPSNMSAAVRVEGHSSKSAVGHATRVQLSTASVRFAAMRMKVVFTASKMKIKSVIRIQQSGLGYNGKKDSRVSTYHLFV